MVKRDGRARMMRRAQWWHASGGLALCPTAAQLRAAIQPWPAPSPRTILSAAPASRSDLSIPLATWTTDRITLPWLGLPLPTPWLLAALRRSDQRATTRWLLQVLLPEDDALKVAMKERPDLADLIDEVRAMPSQTGLPAFLHRCAQIPLADLSWFATHDVRQPWPSRAWPPADDHFPAEVHGHRTVRALRGWSC